MATAHRLGGKTTILVGLLAFQAELGLLQHAIMPPIALGLGSSAAIARLTRASLLQTIREDYIRTARASR